MTERLNAYINSLDKGNSEFLNSIEREAHKQYVPIIRPETQRFLKLILAMQKPERILEIGTAVGFSTLLLAEYNPVPCKIVTIENYEKRIPLARANFEKAGRTEQITLLAGDARIVLPSLRESFDFIFMDAAKGQYIHFLPELIRLLADGGTLVSDNVLQEGDVIESHFAVTRRNRTIHKRMRAYLYEVMHHEELTGDVLPIGDGLAVCTRKRKEKASECPGTNTKKETGTGGADEASGIAASGKQP